MTAQVTELPVSISGRSITQLQRPDSERLCLPVTSLNTTVRPEPSSVTSSADILWREAILGVYKNDLSTGGGQSSTPSSVRDPGNWSASSGFFSATSLIPKITWSGRAQRCVNHMVFQVIMFAVSLLHWLPYALSLEIFDLFPKTHIPDEEHLLTVLFCTGFPILAFTLFELGVRIMEQAGALWRPSSWRRFLLPMFHKFELFVLSLMAYHAVVVSTLLYNAVAEDSNSFFDELSPIWSYDQILATAVIVYRCMRIWGVLYEVSVQATEQAHRERANATKDWTEEYEDKRKQFERRPSVRLQKQVDKPSAQVAGLLLVALHIAVYTVTSKNLYGLGDLYFLTAFTGYFTLAFFAFEFSVRCIAQSGEQFFRPTQQKAEFAFLFIGGVLVLYTTWNRNALRQDDTDLRPTGPSIMTVFTCHRLIRYVGIKKKISASIFDVQSVFDATALEMFNSLFGDLLHVPPPNVQFHIQGNDIMVRVQKARLKREAFQEVLLPFRVLGGLVEDLEIRVQGSMTTLIGAQKAAKTLIRVQNMLLIVNPCPSLAEAGNIKVDQSFWRHETVLKQHSALVELVVCRLRPPNVEQMEQNRKHAASDLEDTPPAVDFSRTCSVAGSVASADKTSERRPTIHSETSAMEPVSSRGSRVRSLFVKAKGRLKDIAKAKSLEHVSISLTNVTMQYEDHLGELGCGHVAFGMKIGKLFFSRVEQKQVKAEILRFGIYMETRSRTRREPGTPISRGLGGDSGQPSIRRTTSCSWRTKLSRMMDSHPAVVIREMKRLEVAERFRLWAFVGIDQHRAVTDAQRHWRYERWPEQRLIFSLMRGELSAGDPSATEVVSQRISFDDTWDWEINLQPLRIVIDDEQVRALRVIVTCLKGWMLQADAFRWRPDLRHGELNEAIRSNPQHTVDGSERRTLARLWWSYAFRRVLALLHMRPRMPWIDVIWTSHSKLRYLNLLTIIIRRQPIRSLRFRPHDDEKEELKELQLRLSIFDIIDCQKRVLAEAAQRAALLTVSMNDIPTSLYRRVISRICTYKRGRRTKESTLGISHVPGDHSDTVADLYSHALRTTSHMHRHLIEGRVNEAADHLVDALRMSTNATVKLADSALVNAADSMSVWLTRSRSADASYKTPDESLGLKPPSVSRQPSQDSIMFGELGASASLQPLEILRSASTKNFAIEKAHVATGNWRCTLPLIEVRILRWQEATEKGSVKPFRCIVLNTKVNEVEVDAMIGGTDGIDEEDTPHSLANVALPIRFTATVGSFSARCQAPDLIQGTNRNVVSITRKCKVGEPTKDLLRGRRIGEEVAVLVRVRVVTGRKTDGVMELDTADIRVVVFEKLLAFLKSFMPQEENPMVMLQVRLRSWDDLERSESQPVKYGSGWSLPSFKEAPPSPVRRQVLSPHLEQLWHTDQRLVKGRGNISVMVQDGRLGPLGARAEVRVPLTHRSGTSASNKFRVKFRERESMARYWRKFEHTLQKEQKRFELLVGTAGNTVDWICDFKIGAVHLVQVGRFLHQPGDVQRSMLEDYRMWPWTGIFKRGRFCRTTQRAAMLNGNGPMPSRPKTSSQVWVSEDDAVRDRLDTSDWDRVESVPWRCSSDHDLTGVLPLLRKPTFDMLIKVMPTSKIGCFLEKEANEWQNEVHSARATLEKFSCHQPEGRRWHCIAL